MIATLSGNSQMVAKLLKTADISIQDKASCVLHVGRCDVETNICIVVALVVSGSRKVQQCGISLD
jgi:hypothetical protein